MSRDVVTIEDDVLQGEPLLKPVMENGRRQHSESLKIIRERVVEEIRSLPPGLLNLEQPQLYPVQISDSLRHLATMLHLRNEEVRGG